MIKKKKKKKCRSGSVNQWANSLRNFLQFENKPLRPFDGVIQVKDLLVNLQF